MKRSSILKKLVIGITVPVIAVFICAGLLISSIVRRTVTDLAMDNLSSESVAASNEVSEFFTEYLAGASQAASSYQMEAFINSISGSARLNEASGYKAVRLSLDKMAQVNQENVLAVWVGDFDTSQVTQSDGFNTEVGWDITTRPWYQVKNTGKPVLTEPYVDASTGQLIVTVAAPIFESGTNEIIGAVGYDIELNQLTDIMQEYKIGEGGFLILSTDSGQIIYHPDAQNIQKNVSEVNWSDNVTKAFTDHISGQMNYTMNGVSYSGSMNQVSSCGWYVLSGMPVSEIMAPYYYLIKAILFIFIIGLVLLTVIITLISLSISRPLKRLAGVAERIANGELDISIDVHTSDETGLVAEAMEKTVQRLNQYIAYIDEISMVLNQIGDSNLTFELKQDYAGEFSRIKDSLLKIKETLSGAIMQISGTAAEVSSGAEHISSGAQALSQGTTEQASSTQELSATIMDISKQVKQNADFSKQADGLVNQVATELMNSSNQMKKLEQAMEQINQSSGEIGKIIKTIEDIAFQTNILALNAAVEAARAGQAGKGFAVVADEVRNLASKSAEAAKDTTTLIEDSVRSVEEGTQLAEAASDSLLKVVEDAKEVTKAIGFITEASATQSDSIGQVAFGIEQISGVVQTNSATAEESAAASEQLTAQAKLLEDLVKRFTI